MDHLEQWISKHLPKILVLALTLACGLRVAYFRQLNSSALSQQHRWEQSDMYFFDQWATKIAAGDWWTSEKLHPQNLSWHKPIADQYFAEHPEELAELSARFPDLEPTESLWRSWSGGPVFHQEPLYPYLVALTYRELGHSPNAVFIWQMLFGLLSVFLVYRISKRHFGVSAAAIALIFASLYGPLLYYEMVLLRSAMISFFTLLLVELADQANEKRDMKSGFLLGLAAGIGMLLTSTFLIFALGSFAAILILHRSSARNAMKHAGVYASGILLPLIPLMIRNLHVGAPLLSMSSVGTVTFINANATDFSPEMGWAISGYAARIMGSAHGNFFRAAIETIQTHASIADYLGLLASKFDKIWHWYEIPNNASYYFYKMHAPVLGGMLTFVLIGPLALLGVLLLLWQKRFARLWPAFLMIITNLVIMLSFYVLSRFRISLAVILIPFAAFALIQIASWLVARQYKPLLVTLPVLAGLILWTNRPLSPEMPVIRAADYTSVYGGNFIPRMKVAADAENWSRVVEIIQDSLRYEPQSVKGFSSTHLVHTPDEANLVRFFRTVHLSYALALRNLHDEAKATLEEDRARELTASLGE